MPEETGDHAYDTSERDGRYEPIRTSPEEGVTQIHTNNEFLPGEKIENTIRRSSQNISKLNRYGSVLYTGKFPRDKIRNVCNITGSNWNARKGTPHTQTTHKPAEFMPGDMTPPGTPTFI